MKIPRVLNYFLPSKTIKTALDKSDFEFNETIKDDDLINFDNQPDINDNIKYRVDYPLETSEISAKDYLKSLEGM